MCSILVGAVIVYNVCYGPMLFRTVIIDSKYLQELKVIRTYLDGYTPLTSNPPDSGRWENSNTFDFRK